MYKFSTNYEAISNDLNDIVRLFIFENDEINLTINQNIEITDKIYNNISIGGVEYSFNAPKIYSNNTLIYQRMFVRTCKLALYDALSAHFDRQLPWGSLTGIRPTKPAYDMLSEGMPLESVADSMQSTYRVSSQKAMTVQNILHSQKDYINRDSNYVNLYIHVPFCTSKCNYCSFTTNVINKNSPLDMYTEFLKLEIEHALKIIEKNNFQVYSIYVGGGTPSALNEFQIEKILQVIPNFDCEFTFEAGRPDTIEEGKLQVLKKYNVTRLSVNPQTFNDLTLKKIGRKHTVEDFYNKYKMANKLGFDINIDLIAGLIDESYEDFVDSVNRSIELKPDNITVHTLSVKNGSEIKNGVRYDIPDIDQMIEYAYKTLRESYYLPYYLYRQKNMMGNLENIGYSLQNKQCRNNISTMEEHLSVIACGAGGISKRIFNNEKRIERLANLRDIKLYFEQFDERNLKKENFFKE